MKKNKKYAKQFMIWLTLVVSMFLASCSNTTSEKQPSHNDKQQVTLVKNVDGDTSDFSVNGKTKRVRYLLIDTPESVKPNTPIQPYGKEASDRTKEILTNALKIEIEKEPGNEEDKYGRSLAFIFADGQLVQKILVEEGLARVAYTNRTKSNYLNELNEAQEQAKQKKIGIWSLEGYVTPKGFRK